MRKLVVMTVLCTLIFTACASENTKQTNDFDNVGTEIPENVETNTDDLGAYMSEQTEESAEESTLYERFLRNEATVHIENSKNVGYYFSFENADGRDCTLEEMVLSILDYYNNDYGEAKLESSEYAYIDCGKDGNEELALRIFTPGIDYWTQYIIIKEFDGQLRTIYSNVEWSRGQTYITEYGYVYSDGSSGASHHVFTKEYIDATGDYHFIYTNYSNDFSTDGAYAGDIVFNGESHNLLEETNTKYPGDFTFFELDLNNTPNDDSDDVYSYAKTAEYDDSGEGFRGYYYCVIEDEPGIFDDKYALKKYCNSKGLKIYTKDEFKELIADKEKAVGLTDEIKNGKNVVWQKIDYSQLFIIDSNTDTEETKSGIAQYIGAYDEIFAGETNGYIDMAIGVADDGTIKLYIGMVRISTLSDGVGELSDDGLKFTATDPAGEPITGLVVLDNDKASLIFTTDSGWGSVLNDEKLEYIKCSDNPNECEGYINRWGTP